MKKFLRIIGYIIGLQILIFIIVFISFMYFADEMCANTISKIYFSPNKSLKAVIFQRDCGATTGFSTQISILDSKEELINGNGNIFIINGHPDSVQAIVTWKNNKEMNIHFNSNELPFKAKEEFGFFDVIKITYK